MLGQTFESGVLIGGFYYCLAVGVKTALHCSVFQKVRLFSEWKSSLFGFNEDKLSLHHHLLSVQSDM